MPRERDAEDSRQAVANLFGRRLPGRRSMFFAKAIHHVSRYAIGARPTVGTPASPFFRR